MLVLVHLLKILF